jgi:hypothetical protein
MTIKCRVIDTLYEGDKRLPIIVGNRREARRGSNIETFPGTVKESNLVAVVMPNSDPVRIDDLLHCEKQGADPCPSIPPPPQKKKARQ